MRVDAFVVEFSKHKRCFLLLSWYELKNIFFILNYSTAEFSQLQPHIFSSNHILQDVWYWGYCRIFSEVCVYYLALGFEVHLGVHYDLMIAQETCSWGNFLKNTIAILSKEQKTSQIDCYQKNLTLLKTEIIPNKRKELPIHQICLC